VGGAGDADDHPVFRVGRIADLILEAVAAAARPRHPKNERRCAFA